MPGADFYFSFEQGEKRPLPTVNWVPYLGASGRLGVVPVGSAQSEAAFSLLADLGGRDTSNQIMFSAPWGGGPIRREHLESSSSWLGLGLEAARTQELLEIVRQTLMHPGLKNPVFLTIAGWLPPLVAGKLMCWGTIAAELAAAFGLLVPRLVPYALWANVLFQVGLLEFTGTTFTLFFYGTDPGVRLSG